MAMTASVSPKVFSVSVGGVSGPAGPGVSTVLGVSSISTDGDSATIGTGALPPSATTGFAYIPSGNGPPTGVPETVVGFVPMYFDYALGNLHIFNNGIWGIH